MAKKLNLPKEATFKGPAAVWKRAIAFIVDIIIIDFVIGFPFRGVIERILPDSSGFSESYSFFMANPAITGILSLTMLLYGLFALLYFVILEYRIGQTIGKIFMNIKVETDKKEKNFFDIIVRNMYFILTFPFVLLFVIDPLFMIFNKDGRRLSEILSKTRTVEIYNLN